MEKDWKSYRDKIIGLGEFSLHKSYYPELQDNIDILESSQKNLQFLIDNISDAIIIYDVMGKILYANKKALLIYNLNETDYKTFTILDITSPRQDLSRLNSILSDFSNISIHAFEWIGIQQKTNIDLPLQISLSPTQWYSKPAMVAVIRDFSERKKFEQELIAAKEKAEESENLYRKMNENSPLGMHFYRLENNQLVFTAANPAASVLLKVDNSQFIGKTIEEAFPTLAQTEVPFRYRNAAENGISWITEQINYNDNRIVGAFEVRAFQTTQGNMVAIFNDITERKCIELELIAAKEKAEANEKKIKEQNEEIENFFSYTIDLLCIANTEGYFIRLNKEWENSLGYSIAELEGKKFLDFVHPDDLEATLQKISQLDNQIKLINFTNRYRCKDGSYKWIEWKSYPNGDKIYAAARDITAKKMIENDLIAAKEKAEESEIFLTAIIENLPGLIWMKDINGKFQKVNSKYLNSCGLNKPEQLYEKTDFDIWPKELAETAYPLRSFSFFIISFNVLGDVATAC